MVVSVITHFYLNASWLWGYFSPSFLSSLLLSRIQNFVPVSSRATACCQNIYPMQKTSLPPLMFTVPNFQVFQQLFQQLIKNLLLALTLALSKESSPSRLVSFWETQPGCHWGCRSLQHTSVFILTCQISCTCSQCYHTFQLKTLLMINHPSLLSPSRFWSLYISFLLLIFQNISTCKNIYGTGKYKSNRYKSAFWQSSLSTYASNLCLIASDRMQHKRKEIS